jgi:hypothetical protein
VPRRDERLSDEERDEMDEWRCKMFLIMTKLPPEKFEELAIRGDMSPKIMKIFRMLSRASLSSKTT